MALTALLNGNSNCNCYSLTPSLSISDVQVVPIEQILDAVCDLRNSVLIDHNHNFLTLCLVFDHCFSSTRRQAQTLMKMPGKRRKYNARFPAGRIKKIMQTDEQVGKVAQAVPIIISRTLELFVQSLLKSALAVTNAKNARTLSPSHMKQCIVSDQRFHFLKDLVRSLPDVNSFDEDGAPSASNSTADPEENLSSYTGRRYSRSNQQGKSKVKEERNNEKNDSEDSDSSSSEKDSTALNQEESTSDFVIDEDYGS